jgi:eukaryotic-like serine/threonine-protein kinase
MADHTGRQLGNYYLLRLLGKGGYAEVYLGQHLYLKIEAAIKIFPTFLTEEDRKAFLSEAQNMARLIHPHIVRVLEGGVDHGTPFLAMDYAPNGTLRDVHHAGTKLAPETVLVYVKQVAAALDYAHQQQLIHRDIKPGNLLVGRYQEVLLSDFGLAVEAQRSHTQPREEVAGTVAYMAPEQIEGKPCPPSDQYSLGVVIFEWLTGTWPFQGSVRDIVAQHLMKPPPLLRDKVPDLPEAIEQVVLRALAKKPEQRFSSVLEFANALEQAIQQGQPGSAAQESAPVSAQPKVTPNLLPKNRNFSLPHEAASMTPSQLAPAPSAPSRPITQPTVPAPQESTQVPTQPQVEAPPPGTTLLTYEGHASAITALAWSPNGKRLASGSWDRTVHIWDAVTGTRILRYRGHATGVTTVAWSPDRKLLASGSDDGAVQVWDAASGQTLFTYHSHTKAITALAWSPDAAYLASASTDLTVHVWKPNTQGKPFVYKGHRTIVEVILWSPDRRRITTVDRDQTVQRWDAASGANVLTSRNPNAPARAAAWSPNGECLATGNEEGLVTLKEASTNRLLLVYRGHSQKVLVVAWSPDGARIASGSADETVQIWQAR